MLEIKNLKASINNKPILKVISRNSPLVNETNFMGGVKQMIKLSNSKLFFDPTNQNLRNLICMGTPLGDSPTKLNKGVEKVIKELKAKQ